MIGHACRPQGAPSDGCSPMSFAATLQPPNFSSGLPSYPSPSPPHPKPRLSSSEDVNAFTHLISSEPICNTLGPWHKTRSPCRPDSQSRGIRPSPPQRLSQVCSRSCSRRPSPGHARACLPSEGASGGVRWLLQSPGVASLISPFHVSPQRIYGPQSTLS